MHTNFLVIGSGISGLNFALNAAKKGTVTIVTKKKIVDSSTNYAQGGIAAVLSQTDDIDSHIKDTLEAGAHHNDKKAVKFMVEHSTEAIYRLIDLGVEFEKENGKLLLTQEGGHGKRRIAYVGDYTGKEIERILVKRVKEHPNITIFEDTFALKLITKRKTCYGAQVISKNEIKNIFADHVVLATGGIGQLFKYTTNPKIATGDGLAMGIQAGCKTQDLEFIQFHPTALAKNTFPRFLISETLRGEGAKLLNHEGKQFVKELTSRDIVSRAIYKELKNGPVYLKINKPKAYLEKRFPQIYQTLKKYGYDLAKDKIPVIPAVHYICGGLKTDLHGRTKIKNLFAFGEVAATGVHGANRLASNSLLEALVFSNQILEKLGKPQKIPKNLEIEKPKYHPLTTPETKEAIALKKQIQNLMWEYAGIVRSRKDIKKIALPAIKEILKKPFPGTNHEIAEFQNMATVAHQILKAAANRKKSLGCHYLDT